MIVLFDHGLGALCISAHFTHDKRHGLENSLRQYYDDMCSRIAILTLAAFSLCSFVEIRFSNVQFLGPEWSLTLSMTGMLLPTLNSHIPT
jgi:hypothetical protein